ncbi:MAG: hypothetical protein ABIS14_15305 [Sphingomonas sp.]
MRMISLIASGLMAVATISVPASAQHHGWHGGAYGHNWQGGHGGWRGGYGGGWHGGYARGWHGGYGGYRHYGWHRGYGRVVCGWRWHRRVCSRVW